VNPDQWQQIRSILESALELTPASRKTFLDGVCADPSLRQEIDSLLLSHDQAGANALNPGSLSLYFEQEIRFRLLPGKRIGPYEIVEEIAQGGMGAVYRAIRADGEYKQQVALKIVRADLGVDLTAGRFRNERQILASLDHSNIAKILDGGTTADGLPYFVMELIDGSPITEYCDQQKLRVDQRLEIFRTVCSAVHYAHQHLVIHRDIKPTNIVVTAEGVPKLLDFGIAKILGPNLLPQDATLTAGGLWPMTPEYASPEQLRGGTITTATDVYSLGLVLYQLLSGHRAYRFTSRMPHDIARAIFDSEPERPSAVIRRTEGLGCDDDKKTVLTPERIGQLRGDSLQKLQRRLAGDLDNIAMKAIRKEPRERYNSVEQFAEDIRRHLGSLPVIARKDTAGYRASRFIQRHKAGVTAAMVVAVAVIAGLGATLYEAHIARAERARAEARFTDVRALANALMFDVHDSIENLPGSTPARKLLVERALRYLDTLSRDSASDASLQRELATAYEKVGTVQGNPFGANLGDTQGALDSYRKSMAIRESLAKLNPKDIDGQLGIARSQRLIGAVMANRGDRDCVPRMQDSLATAERLSQVAPSNPAVLQELQAGYYLLAITLDGYGDYQAASGYLQKLLPIAEERAGAAPEDRVLRRELARVEVKLGYALAKLGSRKDGMVHSQRGLEILESLATDETDAESSRWLGMAHWMVGDILLLDGDATGALHSYRQERRIVQALGAADPTNAVLQYDFACATGRVGNALALADRQTAGLDMLNQAARMFRIQLARDPVYTEPRFCLAATLVWAGEGLARTGESAQALESFQDALAIWDPLALHSKGTGIEADLALIHADIGSALAKLGKWEQASKEYHLALQLTEPISIADPRILDAQYVLAEGYAGLGEVSQILASDTHSAVPQQVRHWTDARDWYRRSMNVWQLIKNPAVRTPVGFACRAPRTVAKELAQCDAALSRFESP
jgi:eukaryotic-like serine/threonine-protein kinase